MILTLLQLSLSTVHLFISPVILFLDLTISHILVLVNVSPGGNQHWHLHKTRSFRKTFLLALTFLSASMQLLVFLHARYESPFQVLSCREKTLSPKQPTRMEIVSIDILKPAFESNLDSPDDWRLSFSDTCNISNTICSEPPYSSSTFYFSTYASVCCSASVFFRCSGPCIRFEALFNNDKYL